jgi:hypothetical protein
VTVVAAPTAAARPIGETHPIGVEEIGSTTPPTVITTTDDGLDWASAGLGAGAAGAIVLLSIAGVAVNARGHVRSVS